MDDTYEITATAVDSAMLAWWLRRFGDAVSMVVRIDAAIYYGE